MFNVELNKSAPAHSKLLDYLLVSGSHPVFCAQNSIDVQRIKGSQRPIFCTKPDNTLIHNLHTV